MDSKILTIKPNESFIIPTKEEHLEIIKELLDDPESIYDCRTVIHDDNGYGIVLPSKITKEGYSVLLPEQLCIFNPEDTYFLKIELLLETQIVTVCFNPCQIDLNGLLEPEDEQDEQNDEEDDEEESSEDKTVFVKSNQNRKEEEDLKEEDPQLDRILDVVAPIKKVEIKKTKVEDIVKQLDEEFVRNAIWQNKSNNNAQYQQPKIIMAPVAVPAPEPLLNDKQLEVKDKIKNLMKKMLS